MVTRPTVENVQSVPVPGDPGVGVPDFSGAARGFGQLSEGFGSVADEFRAKELQAAEELRVKEEQAKVAAQNQQLEQADNALRRRALDIATEAQANVVGQPDGYTDSVLKQYDDDVNKTISTLPSDIQQQARLNAERVRGVFEVNQRQWEHNKRVETTVKSINDEVGRIALDAFRNPMGTMEYLDQAERQVSLGAQNNLIPHDMQAAALEDALREVALSGLRGMDPQTRLDELQRGTFDDEIGDTKLIKQLTDEAQRDLDRLIGTQKSEALSWADDHLASLEVTGQGLPPGDVSQLKAALDDVERKEFEHQEELALRVYHGSQALKTAPPQDMAGVLQSAAPQPGSKTFSDDLKVYNKLQQVAGQEIELRQKDPATAAMQNPAVANKIAGGQALAAENPGDEEAVGAFRRAIDVRLDEQTRQGVSRIGQRPLTNAQAQGMVTNVLSMNVEDRAGYFAGLQDTYGRHYLSVLQQLTENGLGGRYMVLASLADDPVASQKVSQILSMDAKQLKEGLNDTDVKSIRENVVTKLAPFSNALWAGDPSGGRTDQINDIITIAQDLAILNFRSGQDMSSAVQSAVDQLYLKRYTVQDRYYFPNTLDGQYLNGGRISVMADFLKRETPIRAFNPDPLGSVMGASEEVRTEGIISTAVNSGYWVTNEDGTGMFLMVPLVGGGFAPLRQKGTDERYEFSFLDSMSYTMPAFEGSGEGAETGIPLSPGAP